jgi:serine/threonine protein phosphatase PrpC
VFSTKPRQKHILKKMGAYLDKPITEKEIEKGADNKLIYSAVSMQGWRKTQEDSHIAELKLPNGEALFGVFDGHGGKDVAIFVKQKFVDYLVKSAEYKEGRYEEALKRNFIQMDELMTENLSSDPIVEKADSQGCTACVGLITKDTIYCANSGDSRCVLARGTQAVELSEDHKPDNAGELKRIEAAGGFVEDGRVRGILSLSRALGDMEYKMNKKIGVEAQMITCVPEIRKQSISPDDKFMIIACDGIWDCLTSQQAVDLMHNKIKARKNGENSAKVVCDMFDEIICKNVNDPESDGSGTDNMTCILIEVKK